MTLLEKLFKVSRPLDLLLFQTHDIATAYQIANYAGSLDLEILELSVLGSGGLVIVNAAPQPLLEIDKVFRSKFRSDLLLFQSIHANLSETVFKSYLGLSLGSYGQTLQFFEHEDLGTAFRSSNELLKLNPQAQLIDLRLLRGSQPKAYWLATGMENLGPYKTDPHLKTLNSLSENLNRFLEIQNPPELLS